LPHYKVMKENMTTELLRSLSEEEWVAYGLFLQSPYFNRGVQAERILRLYAVLRSAGGELPDKAALAADIFAGEPAAPGKMDKLLSEFNGLLREFLLLQHQKNTTNAFNEALHWAVILRQKGLIKRYDAAMQKAEKVLKAEQVESLDLYYNRFKLEYERHEMESQISSFKGDMNILSVITSLEVYYVTNRTQLINTFLQLGKLVLVNKPISFYEPQRNLTSVQSQAKTILLEITLFINDILLSKQQSPEALRSLVEIIQLHESDVDPDYLQVYYATLRNICSIRLQNGQEEFGELLHVLQRYSLEKGYLLYIGKLSASAYLSIVHHAAKLGKIVWAQNFIEEYKDKLLNKDLQEEYYKVAQAECLFQSGRCDDALTVLPMLTEDTLFYLFCRRLEVKIYYELRSELLPYKLEAYKVFLSRASQKTLSEERRDFEGNFVNLLLQIINCPPGDAFKLDRLERRIREKTTVADRDWLLLKVAELGRK
jgi:hypothetical protein